MGPGHTEGGLAHPLNQVTVENLAFAPDGKRLAVALNPAAANASHKIQLWDVDTQQALWSSRCIRRW